MKSIEKSTTNIDNRPTKSMNLHHPTGPALFLHTQYLAITKGAMATYGNPIMMGSLQPPLSFLFSEVPPLFQKEKKRSHVEPGKQESLAHLVDFSCSAHPNVNGHDHSEGCKKKRPGTDRTGGSKCRAHVFFGGVGGVGSSPSCSMVGSISHVKAEKNGQISRSMEQKKRVWLGASGKNHRINRGPTCCSIYGLATKRLTKKQVVLVKAQQRFHSQELPKQQPQQQSINGAFFLGKHHYGG